MDEDLLNDLEELGGEELEAEEEEAAQGLLRDGDQDDDADMNQHEEEDDLMDDDPDAAQKLKAALALAVKGADDIRQIAKLIGSRTFKDILQKIEHFRTIHRDTNSSNGPVEEDPEYNVIVQANNLIVDIDNDLLVVHKFIRDHYSPKFPELESLILNPNDYACTVQAIGNEMDLTKIDLKALLPSATVMIVTVTATTTNGRPLSDTELKAVMDGCEMLQQLDGAKKMILDYVESRMNLIAPNLSAVVGTGTAAKLMGIAGGLSGLSKIPACNVLVLGAQKKASAGLSSVGQNRHLGLIYYSDIILRTPPEYRRKACRLLSAKSVLAARSDRARTFVDGAFGRKMREEIERKIEKMQEPPPGKAIKALPVPTEGSKKRRGGKRLRRQKEAHAVTELRKAQNRIVFGMAEEEIEVGDDTVGLGMLTQGQTGKIRAITGNPRVGKLPKKVKVIGGSSGNTSGLSSSLAFTPIQGIELENPEAAQQRIKDANNRYFGAAGTFIKVAKNDERPSAAMAPPPAVSRRS
ncbi:uncharacterized protein BJ171DRAFT_519520 [Polychytrium aggregatum]|uniref:uncharacterized protein n=1 Tax=Polychytrium aggregatum TaxID=110093 RepID=UPI0022FE90FD|nr:uncharacterized protein BJ171DRAFT_519520 [Polychytrium aggregatum]KAI9197432.1 hypothetical protein BJ171DRAFT_519520 [Polychytrium aggregatum]